VYFSSPLYMPHTLPSSLLSSRLVTFLKFIYASIRVFDSLVLTGYFKVINFIFQLLWLFVDELSASSMSCIVQIICINLSLICFFSSSDFKRFSVDGQKCLRLWF
jgi:hypothetical protein